MAVAPSLPLPLGLSAVKAGFVRSFSFKRSWALSWPPRGGPYLI